MSCILCCTHSSSFTLCSAHNLLWCESVAMQYLLLDWYVDTMVHQQQCLCLNRNIKSTMKPIYLFFSLCQATSQQALVTITKNISYLASATYLVLQSEPGILFFIISRFILGARNATFRTGRVSVTYLAGNHTFN